mmetsp:Transcript_17857/g.26603  ORF Transcript_17857/g.26603 Transcript_17857/m.26603 type:complete len:94 (-) Transcript_17857:114-395(-)
MMKAKIELMMEKAMMKCQDPSVQTLHVCWNSTSRRIIFVHAKNWLQRNQESVVKATCEVSDLCTEDSGRRFVPDEVNALKYCAWVAKNAIADR